MHDHRDLEDQDGPLGAVLYLVIAALVLILVSLILGGCGPISRPAPDQFEFVLVDDTGYQEVLPVTVTPPFGPPYALLVTIPANGSATVSLSGTPALVTVKGRWDVGTLPSGLPQISPALSWDRSYHDYGPWWRWVVKYPSGSASGEYPR